MGYEGVREALQLLFFAFTFLVCLLSRGLIAETLAILALICGSTGFVLQLVEPSNASLILAYAGSIGAFIVASYALGYAALAPGEVTVHRVLGAIALYLNLGLMFATVYRLIWYFIPNSLTNIPGGADVAGLWYDTLFQLCDADIDRLWRCNASASSCPYAGQCGGHHRPTVSGDPARSPYHAGTSKASAANHPVETKKRPRFSGRGARFRSRPSPGHAAFLERPILIAAKRLPSSRAGGSRRAWATAPKSHPMVSN